jgi:hypothetical protein
MRLAASGMAANRAALFSKRSKHSVVTAAAASESRMLASASAISRPA